MTDLFTQLRDYGLQIESDPMLGAPSPLAVDREVRPPQKARPSWRWVWAPIMAAVVLIAFLPLLLDRSRQDAAVTTIPTSQLQNGNGWVAFPVGGPDGDHDIYLVGLGEQAFRVAGSDSDGLDQWCPAFSPDGARLAYGEAEANDTEHARGTLVVGDVSSDGTLSEAFRVGMGPGSAAPCPTWSPDGKRLAVGVGKSSDGNPPGDIWIVPADNGSPTVLEDMYVSHNPPVTSLYSDMEWSPDGTELAVTGQEGISLYSVADGDWRLLDGTRGARTLSWSPDGSQIVYEFNFDDSPDEIRVVEVDGTGSYLLVGDYGALHGIGPVWSPTGDQIVYQRVCDTFPFEGSTRDSCSERHEVVLVTPDGSETVLPFLQLPGTDSYWWPWRVTWSPDGSHLLYSAWSNHPLPTSAGKNALIAVPLDPGQPPILLYEGGIVSYPEGYQLASQSWGRQAQSP